MNDVDELERGTYKTKKDLDEMENDACETKDLDER